VAPFLGIFSRELGDGERRFLLDHLRDAELEEWPGRGHLGFLTEPDRYAARLRELALRGAEPPRGRKASEVKPRGSLRPQQRLTPLQSAELGSRSLALCVPVALGEVEEVLSHDGEIGSPSDTGAARWTRRLPAGNRSSPRARGRLPVHVDSGCGLDSGLHLRQSG
jgi:hypothetical protein